jgi:predicted enzyme related to lactoylglutathione lyase
MAHPVTWFQITGRDAGPLATFYKKAFAWKMKSIQGGMQMVEAQKPGISGGIGPSQDGSSSVTVYVECPSIETQLKKVEAAGGRLAMPKMELPGGMGFIAGFTDPAGNWVGLWSPPAKSAKKAAASPKKKAAPKKAAKKARRK